jgi:hypothetical protein
MILFAVMILYLALCFVLTRIGARLSTKWHQFEQMADGMEAAAVHGLIRMQQANSKRSYFGRMCHNLAKFARNTFCKQHDLYGALIPLASYTHTHTHDLYGALIFESFFDTPWDSRRCTG